MDKEKFDKYIKTDVLNNKELKNLCYDHNTYYCGNHSNQKLYTSFVFDYLVKQTNFSPIYNRACFIHDLCYSLKPDIKHKRISDRVFISNMRKLFLNKLRTTKTLTLKRVLWMYLRFNIYYLLVRAMTPVYIFQGKIKK